MKNPTLFDAIERLTAVTDSFTDADLGQPFSWRAHGEGIRFALLGTHFELQNLAANLADKRAADGPPLMMAQRILGQFHAAYRDLQGVLTGFDPSEYDEKPTPNDWAMRYVLAHMANAQRTFYALADYGLKMGQDSSLDQKFPRDASAKIFGPIENFQHVMENLGLDEMMTLFDDIHRRTLERFTTVPDKDLEIAGPIWWEGEGYPIHYRLGRMEAHLRQHTIQAVKTRTAISGPLTEAVQLLRLNYNALAAVEAAVLGAPGLGLAEQTALAKAIIERADAAGMVVRQARALVEAVQKGETAEMKNILEANPKLVNATDQQGIPAILTAVYYGQNKAAHLLRESGAEIHIFEAAALGDLEKVQSEATGWPEDIHEFGRDGFTALQLACYFGHLQVASWLMEQGADVNVVARNDMKIRPIHAATARGWVEIVKMLVENGAEVNARQQGGVTALHSAAHNGHSALVQLLVEHGADTTLKTDDGRTAADMALESGHKSLINML